MKQENIKTIAVIGTGQMGAGIAQVSAMAGFDVFLFDVSSEVLDKALEGIEKSLEKFVQKDKISADQKTEILAKIQKKNKIEALKDAQMVIEAVTENEAVKKEVFQKLDQICSAETIFASNTSTIPIGRMAQSVKNPGRFIGMHFMNPVPLMKLIELIRGFHTSEETVSTVTALAEKMGKVVVQSKDFPGFIVNRVLMPMINEAIYTLYEGVAEAKAIDTAMKLGTNQPMGPLALADLIGLDTCLFIMNVIHEGMGDSKYRPCPLLKQYVEAGLLGRKSGRGFYAYEDK